MILELVATGINTHGGVAGTCPSGIAAKIAYIYISFDSFTLLLREEEVC